LKITQCWANTSYRNGRYFADTLKAMTRASCCSTDCHRNGKENTTDI